MLTAKIHSIKEDSTISDWTFLLILGNISIQNWLSIVEEIEQISSVDCEMEVKLRMLVKICCCAIISSRWLAL